MPDTTSTHKFIRTLRDRRKLVRCYTQNIDGLESREELSTDLELGKGHRRRFTKKAVEVPEATANALPTTKADRGCEVVQLHGDLGTVRCMICSKTSQWGAWEQDTFSGGHAPQCHDCAQQDRDRRDRGMRGTAIGTLRPNIVLYGEEHPSGDLLSPITTHDLGLAPDLLIIMGTSLKVHGLKVLVKEFAKAVHQKRNGKVVFVNLTKPASSTWDGVIDYWVNMDCDAWIKDVRKRRPELWQAQGVLDVKVTKTKQPLPKTPSKPKASNKSTLEIEVEKENVVQSKYFSGVDKLTPDSNRKRSREALSALEATDPTGTRAPSTPCNLPVGKKRRIAASSHYASDSNFDRALKSCMSPANKKRPREALSTDDFLDLHVSGTSSEHPPLPASKKRRVETSSMHNASTDIPRTPTKHSILPISKKRRIGPSPTLDVSAHFPTPTKRSPENRKRPEEMIYDPTPLKPDITQTPSKQTSDQLPTPPSSRRSRSASNAFIDFSTIRVGLPETPSRRAKQEIIIWEDEGDAALVEEGEYEGTTHHSPKRRAKLEVQVGSPNRGGLGAHDRAKKRKLL